ncbi:MAG: hypothetical protein LLF83_08780, partial [Methanobacterium sp.]|nr:hypothetical protein [Methanobacterium sp.]
MYISKSSYGFKSIALLLMGALMVFVILPFLFWNTRFESVYLDILKPSINFLIVVLLAYTTWWSYENDRDVFKAWLLISIGMIMYLIANLLYFLLRNVWFMVSTPSIADVFYIAVYPIIIAGLILFSKKPYKIKYKAFLDVIIIMISLFFIVWFP